MFHEVPDSPGLRAQLAVTRHRVRRLATFAALVIGGLALVVLVLILTREFTLWFMENHL